MKNYSIKRQWPLVTVDDLSELTSEDLQKNAIVVLHQQDANGIYRCHKVMWQLAVTLVEFQERYTGKMRKKLRHTHEKAQERGIRMVWEEQMEHASFLRFYKKYEQHIASLPHGEIILKEQWFDDMKKQNVTFFGLSFFEHDTYVGGALIIKKGDLLRMSFSAYDTYSYSELGLGLSALSIKTAYTYAQQHGYTAMSYGKDANFYGYFTLPTLLQFKQRFGFAAFPSPQEEPKWETVFLLQPPDTLPAILFAYETEDSVKEIILTEQGNEEVKAFIPDNIKTVEQLLVSEIIAQHTAYLSSIVKKTR